MSEVKDTYEIKQIRKGKGDRSHIVYAQLWVNGELSCAATLDYVNTKLLSLMYQEEHGTTEQK